MGTKAKLEYIWLDGYKPTQSLRSKTKVVEDFGGKLDDVPIWGFDGSSTEQSPGNSSDLTLKPVALFEDPGRKNGYLVMTEVLNADGTPHESNGRAAIDDDDEDFWFGFEQEYCIWDNENDRPIGFPAEGYPGPQGPYYCSVGAGNAVGREIVDEHLDLCLDAGLTIDGLMAIPPADIEPAPFFALLDELAERHGLPLRSMGMSGDYETAVMLGATHVRVGTALFGLRG